MPIGLKLFFLVLGNISKWIYFGGKKSIDEVSKDNLILGMVVSSVCCLVGFIAYGSSN